jgi:hypothetical protein
MQNYESKVLVHEEEDYAMSHSNYDDDDDIQFDMDIPSTPATNSIANSYESPSPSDEITSDSDRMGRFSKSSTQDSDSDEDNDEYVDNNMPFAFQPLKRSQMPPSSLKNAIAMSASKNSHMPSQSFKNVSFAENMPKTSHIQPIEPNESALSSSMKQYNAIKLRYMKTLNIPVPVSNVPTNENSSPSMARRNRTVSAPPTNLAKSMPLAVPNNVSENRDWKMERSVYGDEFIPPHELVKHDTFSVWQYEQRKYAANKAV